MTGGLVLVIVFVALPPLLAVTVHLDRRFNRPPVRQPVGWWTPPPPRRHARARR